MNAALAWDVRALLGEGPLWSPADDALWFVDIKGGRLHRFDPGTGGQTFDVGGRPSFIAPLGDDGAMLVGNGHELLRVEHGVAKCAIAAIDMPAHNRTNDATVDPAGRLWFGTMDDKAQLPSGRVYRFDGTVREMGGACTITNGPAVSPDGGTLYHVDTLARHVWAFPIGGDVERLENGRLFVEVEDGAGKPDGVTVDSEGCLWVALWGGWSVRRYAPDGTLMTSVALPCSQVTKIAFGGPDLRTAYVTTARIGLTPTQLAEEPLAGGLFTFEAPAPGLLPHSVTIRGD